MPRFEPLARPACYSARTGLSPIVCSRRTAADESRSQIRHAPLRILPRTSSAAPRRKTPLVSTARSERVRRSSELAVVEVKRTFSFSRCCATPFRACREPRHSDPSVGARRSPAPRTSARRLSQRTFSIADAAVPEAAPWRCPARSHHPAHDPRAPATHLLRMVADPRCRPGCAFAHPRNASRNLPVDKRAARYAGASPAGARVQQLGNAPMQPSHPSRLAFWRFDFLSTRHAPALVRQQLRTGLAA